MPEPMRFGAVIVAAGSGTRFGGAGPSKQFRELLGAPLLAWALDPFLDHPGIARTVVVLPKAQVEDPPEWLGERKALRVAGGALRGDSVRAGLEALGSDIDRVLVHDGARPLVSRPLIDRILAAAREGAVVPGLPVTDTLKRVGAEQRILGTVDRTGLWSVQTPQAFPRELLLRLHSRASREGVSTTDDAALFEQYGEPVRILEGDPRNLKITTPHDLELARHLAQSLPREP